MNKGVHTAGVGVKDRLGLTVDHPVVGPCAGGETEAAHELVLLQRPVAHHLGPPAPAPAAVVFHVPQPVLSGNETLGEEGVELVLRAHVGNAQPVAVNLDLAPQPWDP